MSGECETSSLLSSSLIALKNFPTRFLLLVCTRISSWIQAQWIVNSTTYMWMCQKIWWSGNRRSVLLQLVHLFTTACACVNLEKIFPTSSSQTKTLFFSCKFPEKACETVRQIREGRRRSEQIFSQRSQPFFLCLSHLALFEEVNNVTQRIYTAKQLPATMRWAEEDEQRWEIWINIFTKSFELNLHHSPCAHEMNED